MDSLFLSLLNLDWIKSFYSVKSTEEKTYLWNLLYNRLNQDDALLQDFQMDRVPVELILQELIYSPDLVLSLPDLFLSRYHSYLRLRLKDKELLISSKKVLKQYGNDIGVQIKINALKELATIEDLLSLLNNKFKNSNNKKLKVKTVLG